MSKGTEALDAIGRERMAAAAAALDGTPVERAWMDYDLSSRGKVGYVAAEFPPRGESGEPYSVSDILAWEAALKARLGMGADDPSLRLSCMPGPGWSSPGRCERFAEAAVQVYGKEAA